MESYGILWKSYGILWILTEPNGDPKEKRNAGDAMTPSIVGRQLEERFVDFSPKAFFGNAKTGHKGTQD